MFYRILYDIICMEGEKKTGSCSSSTGMGCKGGVEEKKHGHCPSAKKAEADLSGKEACKEQARRAIENSIKYLIPDWEVLHKEIMQQALYKMVKMKLKEKCAGEKSHCGMAISCDKECNIEECVQGICKEIIRAFKGILKERIDLALDVYKKLKGDRTPRCGGCKMAFIKDLIRLLKKMHEAAGCGKEPLSKESLVKLATIHWAEHFSKKAEGSKNNAAIIAKNAIFFHCETDCDEIRKAAATARLSKILKGKWFIGTKIFRSKLVGDKPGESNMTQQVTDALIEYANKYVKENCEKVKESVSITKAVVEEQFKDCTQCSESCKTKLIAEIVAEEGYFPSKKTKEEHQAYVQRYIKNIACCCGEECLNRCAKIFEKAMIMSGIKDDFTLRIGSQFGAHLCCKVNGKAGCPEDVVIDFASKWIKDFLPIVVLVAKITEELLGECKELYLGDFEKYNFGATYALWFLKWNCSEGKFEEKDYRSFWKLLGEDMKKFIEDMPTIPDPYPHDHAHPHPPGHGHGHGHGHGDNHSHPHPH